MALINPFFLDVIAATFRHANVNTAWNQASMPEDRKIDKAHAHYNPKPRPGEGKNKARERVVKKGLNGEDIHWGADLNIPVNHVGFHNYLGRFPKKAKHHIAKNHPDTHMSDVHKAFAKPHKITMGYEKGERAVDKSLDKRRVYIYLEHHSHIDGTKFYSRMALTPKTRDDGKVELAVNTNHPVSSTNNPAETPVDHKEIKRAADHNAKPKPKPDDSENSNGK